MTPATNIRAITPRRTGHRLAATAAHHTRLATRLTPRDRWITRMLAEHRVLTSTHLLQLAFPSRRAANLRLTRLYTWRVCDRFQPYTPRGSTPHHYVLDTAGAHLLAREDGINPTTLGFRPEHSTGIAFSLRLNHLLGVNSFFTALIHHTRTHPHNRLLAWWPETRCTSTWGDTTRPDAYGRWADPHGDIEWFLEYDTGSYALPRVVSKLDGYAHLAATTAITTPILFCFPNPHRETHARAALTAHRELLTRPDDLPIATTTEHLHHTNPTGPVWLPLDAPDNSSRSTLTGLRTAWPHLTPLPPHKPVTTQPDPTQPTAQLRPPTPMPPPSDQP